jgi:ABC-type bacteriocin/lantibiotic exporter with double-glycine peptidase domain
MEEGTAETPADKPYNVPYKRIFALSRPETFYIILGLISCCGNGAIMPIFSIVYSQILQTFNETVISEMRTKADFLAEMFLVLAIGSGVFNFLQISLFGVVGERLTFRLRGKHQTL